jgi:hypothetical protein
MVKYSDIRKSCSKGKYARGGRVPALVEGKRGAGKTVINIITAPPAAPAGPAMPPPAPPPPAPPPAPPGGPGAGPAALQALGAGGPPPMGQFRRGGRVKAGAATGVHRLAEQKARSRK